MRSVDVMFGKGKLAVEIDDAAEVTVVEKPAMPLIEDPGAAIQAAIDAPDVEEALGALPPLAEFAKGKQTACILICDITRPVPNGLVLPALVRTIMEQGVPKEKITVLVRPSTPYISWE